MPLGLGMSDFHITRTNYLGPVKSDSGEVYCIRVILLFFQEIVFWDEINFPVAVLLTAVCCSGQ